MLYARHGRLESSRNGELDGAEREGVEKYNVLAPGRRREAPIRMVQKLVRLVRWPLLCLATIGAVPIAAQIAARPATPPSATHDRTVWDGVYSAEQADRGSAAYERHCAACHGNGLTSGSMPALLGESFTRNWSEDDLSDLFEKIRSTMPPNIGRNLSDDTYIDIVAYVLQQNAFPSGATGLEPNPDTLRHIRIENRSGPGPVPSFALVKVVGCLERRVGDEWMLTHATEAVRTRLPYAAEDPDAHPDPALARDLTFRLFGIYPNPDLRVGHGVEVRGFLIRNAEANRINVTSLRTVTPACSVNQK